MSQRAPAPGSRGRRALRSDPLRLVLLLIGVLVHGMIILMAGKPIDDYLRKKGKEVFEPGQVK